jgi:hypothetical protein
MSSTICLFAGLSLILWVHSDFGNLPLLAVSLGFDGTAKTCTKNYKANSCFYPHLLGVISWDKLFMVYLTQISIFYKGHETAL